MNDCPMPEWWGTGPLYLYALRERAEHIARLLKANMGDDYRVHKTADGLYWLSECHE